MEWLSNSGEQQYWTSFEYKNEVDGLFYEMVVLDYNMETKLISGEVYLAGECDE